MFSHVMIGTNDIEESRAFYDKLFEALGSSPGKLYPNLTGQKSTFIILTDLVSLFQNQSMEMQQQ